MMVEALMSKLDLAKEQHKDLVEARNRYRKNITDLIKKRDEAKQQDKQGTAQDHQRDIEKHEQELKQLNEQIIEYEKAIKEADEAELNKATKQIEKFGREYNLRWIADMSRFVSLKNEHQAKDKINLVYKQTKTTDIIGILNIWSGKPGFFDDFSWQDIRLMCERAKLGYESLQVSFNTEKWGGGHSFNLMSVMRDYWVKIDPRILDMTIDSNDECMKYDTFLDDWLYTLNGGKVENINHTKEFVIQKLLYPEQFTDSGSVNPYYTGTPGGNGKGILVIVLATLFTPMSIVMSRAKEMAESFNSRQQGKLFNIIDEGDEGHISQAVLKKRSGSEEIVIEGKGLEPVTMDRTESMIIFDNSGNTVELKGPGEDRRWSVIETNLVMLDYFVSKMNISREDAAEICGFIAELAKDRNMMQKMANRWCYDLIQQHKEFYIKNKRLPKLVALHGQDYNNRIESKKNGLDELFEELLPIIQHYKFIPFKWLKDISHTKSHNISDTDLSDKFDEYMKRNGFPEVKRVNTSIKVLWQGVEQDPFKCMIRKVGNGPLTFDFAHISTQKYAKGIHIDENTLNINLDSNWAKTTNLSQMRSGLMNTNYKNIGV
jgi:hypothetical protein